MASIHLINTTPGDCTIIQHNRGRVSMVDICDGNIDIEKIKMQKSIAEALRPKGNFAMCNYPTNPIGYAKSLGITSIFRFILSHPDMDHMDGFDALVDEIGIANFWHAGSTRDKPDFEGSPYREQDWDRYEKVKAGFEPGVTTLVKNAGARFAFANREEDGSAGGDGLYILAPDAELLKDADMNDDINHGSIVLLYRSSGGRILLPGDAHDPSWEFILTNYSKDVANSSFLLAPHHGRDSDRSYEFLDVVAPKLTLLGCSPSEHIDYEQWRRRGLDYITSNQAGNVVLETADNVLHVYVENAKFAAAKGANLSVRNAQGYVHLQSIIATPE